MNQFDLDYINMLPKDSGSQRDISSEAVWSLSSCKVDYKSDESYTPQKVQVYTGNSILDLDEPAIVMNFNEPAGWQVIDLRKNNQSCVRAFVIQVQILQNHQSGRIHVLMQVLGPYENRSNSPESSKYGIRVVPGLGGGAGGRPGNQSCVRAFVIQVQILQNHQSGRDTHVRACKVLGPRGNDENVAMTTNDLMQAFKRGDIIFDYCPQMIILISYVLVFVNMEIKDLNDLFILSTIQFLFV
ncbi:Anaphase-promoting complex subunit 10 [Aphelenchoides bicaudatus]|nr:Anaphase-promoting complex subunit 10 [Aphelenchoides bicaudatus]